MENQSKAQSGNLWGILLIAAGGLLLLDRFVLSGTISHAIRHLISSVIMAGMGVFVYNTYKQDQRGWKLLLAYILIAIAGVNLLSFFPLPGDVTGAYVMFAIALPFLYVYMNNNKNWWALIPAGIMGAVGVGLLIGAVVQILPALLIVAGVYLLVRYFAESRSEPAADR